MLTINLKMALLILGLMLSVGILYSTYKQESEEGQSKIEALLETCAVAYYIMHAAGLACLIWVFPFYFAAFIIINIVLMVASCAIDSLTKNKAIDAIMLFISSVCCVVFMIATYPLRELLSRISKIFS